MVHSLLFSPEKFGTLLGHAPGGVAIYSSHYASVDAGQFPDRESFRSVLDDVYMGYKWQCVEFARRWLYLNHGLIFEDVAMAYDIFSLRHWHRVADDAPVPVYSFANGGQRAPEVGSVLIWEASGEFEVTGHVAIITDVLENSVRFAEQNVEHCILPEGQHWSRELSLKRTANGGYLISSAYPDSHVLGWIIRTDDSHGSVEPKQADPALFNLQTDSVARAGQAQSDWLNPEHPAERAFIKSMAGHRLTEDETEQYRYFSMSEAAATELVRATNELHLMFLHATQRVINDEQLLEKFNIPRSLWPRLRQSWENRRGKMITGRLDFSMSERGLKVFEYNADSASCYLETGLVQGRWARHFGCDLGRDAGAELFEQLVDAWRESGVDDVLHIMQDKDLEETYHAQFMKSAVEAAGIPCKVIKGVAGLGWSDSGEVIDSDGHPIRWVWKTWAWETALDQLRSECEEDDLHAKAIRTAETSQRPPRLVDVLLRPQVMVFEPFWTLIPSNKAILPVLWRIFPDHPYLLNAQFELQDDLQQQGYVTKPIAGRCGLNISIYDNNDQLVKGTQGRFETQDQIFQQFFKLPNIAGYNVQVCSFSVQGSYAGACIRVDHSPIINNDSDLLPLRIVPDDVIAANL